MKEFGILKLNVGDKIRTLNYTTLNEKLYVLTKGDSKKITDIKLNNQVELAFSAKEQVTAEATIISDGNFIKQIFDKMLSEESTHFTVFKDNLVVIEFKLNERKI